MVYIISQFIKQYIALVEPRLNLKIPQYIDINPGYENNANLPIKLVLKSEITQAYSPFLFSKVQKEKILKENLNLDATRICQDNNVQVFLYLLKNLNFHQC